MKEKYVLFQNEVRNGFFVPALLKRAWNAEIGVLEFVDRVCKKYGIKYFADYGTLLGAARHGGYIPWDDDIDIGMLRSDYNRFIDIMLNSPEEDYTIDCFMNKEDHTDYLIKVKTKGGINSDSEHMIKYGGFPFVAGIDIFVYDYLPKTIEGKKEIIADITYALETLNKMEEYGLDDENERIEQIEKKCSFRIDREKDLSNQIRQAIDNRLSLCREEDSDEIVIFAEWLKNIRLSYPKEIFNNYNELKFESIDIPVLEKYEFILEKEFGEYIEIHMDNSAHDFPFYEHSINKLINNKENLPFFDLHRFEFKSEDIAREKCCKTEIKKEYYIEQYNLILGAMVSICNLLNQNETDVFNELEKVQELAILFGNRIEISTLNNRDRIVLNVETFCELLYELVLKVESDAEDYQDEIKEILSCLERISDLIKEGIFEDKERIAFIFERNIDWEALEPLYQKEKRSKDKIVYAIPVPYFEYTESMERGKLCFDFEDITEQNIFNDYRSFDFSKEYFDKIYFTNAYEIYDWGTFVAPMFFSKKLQKISPMIIFVQSFKVKDFTKDNQRMKYSVGDYARTPGVINADEIIVQSDVLRDRFVEILTEMSGTELEEVWKNKVKSLSCILGKASENNRNVPSEMVIKKVLYYINNSQVATYTELKKQQIKENLEYLAQKDVYLCVDEILKDCIKDNGYKSDFLRFINELTEKEKLHLIAENDVCPEDFDIYVGDRSSLTTVFLEKGIKVLLSPISIDQENYKDIIEMPD